MSDQKNKDEVVELLNKVQKEALLKELRSRVVDPQAHLERLLRRYARDPAANKETILFIVKNIFQFGGIMQ